MKQLTTTLLVALLTMSACKSQTQSSAQSSAQSKPATPSPAPSAPTPSPVPAKSPSTQAFEMDEMEDLSCGEARKVWVAQIKTLQLENQIAKLEGRPQPNRIAIAKLEGKIDEEDMLRNSEETVVKQARILEKNNPDIAAALQEPEKAFLDSISVARRANASGSKAELKAALTNMSENNKAAQAAAQAYLEKVRRAWQADCEKRGGVLVESPTGSACKSKE
jgi:hypothetical protein